MFDAGVWRGVRLKGEEMDLVRFCLLGINSLIFGCLYFETMYPHRGARDRGLIVSFFGGYILIPYNHIEGLILEFLACTYGDERFDLAIWAFWHRKFQITTW